MSDRTIELPAETVAKLSQRLDATEFQTVDEYAAFVLDQVLDELRRQNDGPLNESELAGDRSSGDDVESRLESLGYL
jgi:hypothetical protein